MKLAGKFLRRSPAEHALLLESILFLSAVRLGLWLLPFRIMERLIGRYTGRVSVLPESDPLLVERIAGAVTRSSRLIPAASCLTQALTTHIVLRRRRIPTTVRIGVNKDERDRLIAHAWVECLGRIVVGGPDVQSYKPLLILYRDHP